METSPSAISNTTNNNNNNNNHSTNGISDGTNNNNNNMQYSAALSRLLNHSVVGRVVNIRTLADSLPFVFYSVVTNGKTAAIVLIGVYLALVICWLPFWLVSYAVTEYGIYSFGVGTVFFLGKALIRLIALPGSSQRVTGEIENEFTRYSVRMLISAAGSITDLASALLYVSGNQEASSQTPTAANPDPGSNYTYYDIPNLWKRARSYRDLVLAVYWSVLCHVFQEPMHDDLESRSETAPELTRYGTNRLVGDIGNLSGLTPQARADGRRLLDALSRVLKILDALEKEASPVLKGNRRNAGASTLSEQGLGIVKALMESGTDLTNLIMSLKPPSSPSEEADVERGDISVDSMRRRFEEESGSAVEALKAGAASILPMLDPPPHTSIFCFDVQRGCMLSRYRGARQLWVRRPLGGMIDVIHIPSPKRGALLPRNPRAVMYCNPNAGLIEVATGLSLAGGNIASDDDAAARDNCWVDFYTEAGIDVYLFNYAGFGRSYGSHCCTPAGNVGETYVPGTFSRLRRIVRATFFSFKPTPATLRADGVAVATHLITEGGVSSLIIHGESIGGVAASGTARFLTQSPSTKGKISLLVCDRTFANLEAVSQRLVGGWAAYAIRMLTPTWNTDVVGDYLAANCPKVVANDAADAIIADPASLKSGVAIWKEVRRGVTTSRVGWKVSAPVAYRMADWEDVSVNESKYAKPVLKRTSAPTWPADRSLALEEAFHFAACARRIAKLSSAETRSLRSSSSLRDEEGGYDSSSFASTLGNDDLARVSTTPIVVAWRALSSCDGLSGAPLGSSVKDGFDTTVAWLCCAVTFGGQVVVEQAEQRLASSSQAHQGPFEIVPTDFDCRPPGYESEETEMATFAKPIPEVVAVLRSVMDTDDGVIARVKSELAFVVGVLEYIVARLSSAAVVESSQRSFHLHPEASGLGAFMNLHCGHNNAFAKEERKKLRRFLDTAAPPSVVPNQN